MGNAHRSSISQIRGDGLALRIGWPPAGCAADARSAGAGGQAHVRVAERVRVDLESRKDGNRRALTCSLPLMRWEHAARGNMEIAVLLAGDLDFEPLLNSLVRLGVRTQLFYVPQHTSKPLMRAADEIRKITLQHFHEWSAPSFQRNYPAVQFCYNESYLDTKFKAVREGVWDNRRVRIIERPSGSSPVLHVERRDEVRQQSYTIEYPDINKLPLAFELTFGKVEWR